MDDYLKAKRDLLHAGEINHRTFGEYYSTCERVVGTFGLEKIVTDLTPEGFWPPTRQASGAAGAR